MYVCILYIPANIVFYKSILLYNKNYHTQWKESLIHVTVLCCLDTVETTVISAWQVRNAIEKMPD